VTWQGGDYMKWLLSLTCLLVGLPAVLCAQTVEHQRTAAADRNDFLCTLSYSSVFYSITTDGIPSLELDSALGIDLRFRGKIGFSGCIPFIVLTRSRRYSGNESAIALGDPTISMTATGRTGAWQLSAQLGYSYPLGIWNPYQAKQFKLMSGNGYHRIEGSVSALRYMDPMTAGFSVGAEHCFGKSYRFGLGTIPLSVSLGFFATEALNGAAALSAGVYQRYSSAPEINGVPEESAGKYSLSASVSLLLYRNQRSLSIGLSKSLSDLSSPAALRAELTFTFQTEDKR